MRTLDINEWFDRIEKSKDDLEAIRAFVTNLDHYTYPPSYDDMLQFVNFLSAIRLHQLKHTRLPGDSRNA